MTSRSQSMAVFLKSSLGKIQGERENWNKKLQESLRELDDPKYEKAAQAIIVVILRFFLLQLRLATGFFLFLLSAIFLRVALESLRYLPWGLLFFFFSFACLAPLFTGSAFKPWRELFLTVQFKRLTLALFLQGAFLCMSFRTVWIMARMVWDFFARGMAG